VSGAPTRTPTAAADRDAPHLGSPRVHLRRTRSTNDRARELALAGAPSGTLVTAGEQTAGRGRQGRRWLAPANSALLMSLLLRWAAPERTPPLLPLIAAVAVCDAADASSSKGEQAQIKWPNDVVIAASPAGKGGDAPRGADAGGRGSLAKLAGILVEGRPQQGWAVIGVGLNVAVRLQELEPELRAAAVAQGGEPTAGLPAATLGLPQSAIEPTLARLLAALEQRLGEPAHATLGAWRSRDALLGREIAWASGRGRAEGIDGAGRLVVALDGGGRTTLDAGEVHLRTPA